MGRRARRDPQAVLDDVWDEYVSIEGAARDYGVVITGSLEDCTLALDPAATEALRLNERVGHGPTHSRGAGRSEASVKLASKQKTALGREAAAPTSE